MSFFLLNIQIILKNVLIFILVLNTKYILKNVGNQTVAGPPVTFFLSKSVGTSNCLITNILQNILFCVQHKNKN